MLSLMHPWERDARLLKKALKKGPPHYNVIVEIAYTRSSDQLLGARKAYHSLFDRSIEEDLASHVKGSERKVHPSFFTHLYILNLFCCGIIRFMCCFEQLLEALVSAYRYEGPKVKEDAAKSEAKALFKCNQE